MGIPMLKVRRSRDHLIFNMGIPILVRRHLYIERPPGGHNPANISSWHWSSSCPTRHIWKVVSKPKILNRWEPHNNSYHASNIQHEGWLKTLWGTLHNWQPTSELSMQSGLSATHTFMYMFFRGASILYRQRSLCGKALPLLSAHNQ